MGQITNWEWEYKSNPPRWVSVGQEWQAIVERVRTGRGYWSPRIERVVAPHDRYDGPTSDDPARGRMWCLAKIGELQQSPMLAAPVVQPEDATPQEDPARPWWRFW